MQFSFAKKLLPFIFENISFHQIRALPWIIGLKGTMWSNTMFSFIHFFERRAKVDTHEIFRLEFHVRTKEKFRIDVNRKNERCCRLSRKTCHVLFLFDIITLSFLRIVQLFFNLFLSLRARLVRRIRKGRFKNSHSIERFTPQPLDINFLSPT